MANTDERMDIDADDVQIDAKRVIVNTGWSVEMARWNTIGTVTGAFVSAASLMISVVTLVIVLTQ